MEKTLNNLLNNLKTNKMKKITKSVIKLSELPLELQKDKVFEEVAERLYPIIETNDYMDWYDKNYDIRNSFIAGAKWQQERSYSEKKVKSFLNDIISEIGIIRENIEKNQDKMSIHLVEGSLIAFESSIDVIKQFIKQFKKK